MNTLRETNLTETLRVSQQVNMIQFNLWHELLSDAFFELHRKMREKYLGNPEVPVPVGLDWVVDAFGAYARCDTQRLAVSICQWRLFRPFPN